MHSGRHFLVRLCHGRPTRFNAVPRFSSYSKVHYGTTCPDDGNNNAPTASANTTRVLLPTLGQNGTLVLRSNSNSMAEVQIISQWRDDALLELLPISSTNDTAAEGDSEIATFDDNASSSETFGRLQLKSHSDGITTSLGRKGTLIELDVLNSSQDHADTNNEPAFKLIATVPEKFNITFQIGNGDIHVDGKLEGDAHLATSNGNITVSKLRGYNITLDTTSNIADDGSVLPTIDSTKNSLGVIHVRKAIEARTVQIKTASRVRARMVNGSNVAIHVIPSKAHSTPCFNKLDDDDEGAIIDVGSLYVSNGGGLEGAPDNEARLIVDDTNIINHDHDDVGLVRVKSSHGHVTVLAKTTNQNNATSPSLREGQPLLPLIDLGGVNGSCDIILETTSKDTTDPILPSSSNDVVNDDIMATLRVHFDSMAPESISTITTRGGRAGQASITMDRKVEADVRLLSVANSATGLPSHVDAYSLTSDEMEDVRSALMDINTSIQNHQGGGNDMTVDGKNRSISIETDAYNGEWGLNAFHPEGKIIDEQQNNLSPAVEYTQGTMKNRSGEPDSRFDVRSRGKINIDGAASQALHGFRGKQKEESSASGSFDDSSPSPLLVVATDGEIKLETLSWFGSIARRYGLEEDEKDGRGVGRRASRSPRLDE